MAKDKCFICSDPSGIIDSYGRPVCNMCWGAGKDAQYPPEDSSFDFGLNALPEISFDPVCNKCGCTLCEALDKTWSDDQDAGQCYKCRRNPNRKWSDK